MKKILFLLLITIIVFFTYIFNIDKKELIFQIGDSISLSKNSYGISSYNLYIKDYLDSINKYEDFMVYGKTNYKIGELKRDIENNIKINNRNIQNILIKADLIIIEIGIDDLVPILFNYSKENIYEYLDGITSNMDLLISTIKKYCKEKILLVGYYNPYLLDENNKYIEYINKNYQSLSSKHNIFYLDIDNLNNDKYFSNPNNYYLNDNGYKFLNEQIIKLIYEN